MAVVVWTILSVSAVGDVSVPPVVDGPGHELGRSNTVGPGLSFHRRQRTIAPWSLERSRSTKRASGTAGQDSRYQYAFSKICYDVLFLNVFLADYS